jgi:hypothetical protein
MLGFEKKGFAEYGSGLCRSITDLHWKPLRETGIFWIQNKIANGYCTNLSPRNFFTE